MERRLRPQRSAQRLAKGGIIAAVVVGATLATAEAASFNCARASLPIERRICETPALDRVDGEMGQLYNQLRRQLPPGRAAALRQQQRQWLRYRNAICRLAVECLIVEYAERNAALERQLRAAP